MPLDSFLFLCGFFSLATLGLGLRLLRLRVPPVVDVRDAAVLACEFDLEGDRFLSLKWYKEELEFFRYMPDFVPRIQTFKVDGVNLVESRSNMSAVLLSPLEYGSSGLYRCEVSAEAPHFKVVYSNANMSVLGLPREDPKVEGVRASYSVGSYVSANCTSSPSYPPAKLDWFINGAKAQQWFLDYYYVDGPETSELHLESRTIGLKFQAEASHFQQNDGFLSLVCLATVADSTRSTETKAYLTKLTKEKFAQHFSNDHGRIRGEIRIQGVVLLVVVSRSCSDLL